MNSIPKKLRAEMAVDPFYAHCCVTGEPGTREDPIQWHHNLIFAGRQVQKMFAIVPLKQSLHARVTERTVRDRLDWVMLGRASEEELIYYSKAVSLVLRRDFLNSYYGSAFEAPKALQINY